MPHSVRFLVAVFSLILVLPQCLGAQPVYWAGNGHRYELVTESVSWATARDSASTMSWMSVSGYLATITSQDENEFISTTFASGEPEFFVWIGGNEPGDDGVWLWDGGSEAGVQFSNNATPTAPYHYANWGGVEPNDFAAGEDFAAINLGDEFAQILPGQWGDAPDPGPDDPVRGFLVEYDSETPVELRTWGAVKALLR